MRKAIGLLGLLAALLALVCLWQYTHSPTGRIAFLSPANMRNVLTWIGLFGILSLGQAAVIITGGIDLSVGSVVALCGVAAAMLLDKGAGWHPAIVLPLVLLLAAAIGLWHGLLITKARLQPFVVTLCGLFIFRGLARFVAKDQAQGFGMAFGGLKELGRGMLPEPLSVIPIPFVVFLLLALVLGAYLHFSAPGRYVFALGANRQAARFSGICVDRHETLAYVICSIAAGIGALLIAFKVNSLSPSVHGSFYELYAIAGAVLGGCSLRGGSGHVGGIVIGASIIILLRNLVNILQIPSELEYVVIGGAILTGVMADELLFRRTAARQTLT